MPQQLISNINGIDIVTVEQEGEVSVPIKPICEAIGIDVEAQRNKLNADEFFNSVTAIITATAADDKAYDFCASTGVIMTSVEDAEKEREHLRTRLNGLLLECYSKAKERKDKRTMERVAEAYGRFNPQIRFIP